MNTTPELSIQGFVIWFDLVADAASIVAALAVLITAAFVWRQLRLQNQSLTTDERRFRRESAQAVFAMLQESEFRQARDTMLAVLNSSTELPNKKSDIDAFRRVLSTYEVLGIQVKLDALDADAWRLYWRRALLRDWARCKTFIDHERKRFDHPQLYADAEVIVKAWTVDA